MTTGWDRRDGSRRIQCNDTDPESFKAKVFAGRAPWPGAAAAPTVAVGAADFSFEVWIRRKVGNSPGSDIWFFSGVCENQGIAAWPRAALQIGASTEEVVALFNNSFSVVGSPLQSSLWSHYAVNFDRDGNMEFFIDTLSVGTDDISGAASDLGSVEVHPLVGEDSSAVNYGDPDSSDFEDWDYVIFPCMVGPFALHNRLLTGAELEQSYLYHKVNSFGAATTLVLYDWTIENETGWDDDPTHVIWGIRAAMPLPMSMPTGTAVRAVDRSGNANHWTLPTSATYGQTLATSARVAFCSEPFFRG